MGHNHSTQHKSKLSTKHSSNKTNPRSFIPKLKLSNSPSQQTSNSSTASVQSIPSFCTSNTQSLTIKDMMTDIIHKQKKEKEFDQTAADYEKFFIEFHQKQCQKVNAVTVYDTAIQHRVAFVSLIGLYQSFRRIPTHILFSAMFILKIRREWLYNPQSNDSNNVLHTLQYDLDTEFLMLLKWKDSQNLLFFMHSDSDSDSGSNPTNANTIAAETHTNNSQLPNDFGLDNIDDSPFDFIDEIVANHNQLPMDVNMHEVNMNSTDAIVTPTPVTPLNDDEINNFVPPLRLQLLPIIDEDEDNEILQFNIDDNPSDEEQECDGDKPVCQLTLPNHCEPALNPITPIDFGIRYTEITVEYINPIWSALSEQLSLIYDPFNGTNYSSLILDTNWWKDTAHFDGSKSMYGTRVSDILAELMTGDMSYRSVMEILFQSNPSLIPCKTYRELENVSISAHNKPPMPRPCKLTMDEINNMSANSQSMTNVASMPDYFENEFSADMPCDWIIGDYDSNCTKYVTNQTFQI